MSKQDPYLELAHTFNDAPEEQRAPRLKMLEYVANLYPEFRELRAAVRAIKAAI